MAPSFWTGRIERDVNMLDKTSKRVLKFIIENEPNMDDGYFTYDYIEKNLDMKKEVVFDCVRFLEDNRLVKCKWKNPVDQEGLFGFRANHRGRNHAEFARKEFCRTIFESVLLPVIVSIIAALIVSG